MWQTKLTTQISGYDSNWLAILTRTEFSNSEDIMAIEVNENRTGWVVPLNSIMNRDDCIATSDNPLETNLLLDRAITALIFDEQCYKYFQFSGNMDDAWTLFDFYDKSTAVILFDISILQNHISNPSTNPNAIEGLKGMLASRGYTPFFDRTHSELRIAEAPINHMINVFPLSLDLVQDADILTGFVINAAEARTLTGMFFNLYQTIEYLSVKVYETASGLVDDYKSVNTVQPYKLNRTLKMISGQETQLKWVLEKFCDSLDSADDFVDAANSFLRTINQEGNYTSCHKALYQTRNEIVHSQARFSRIPQALAELQNVNLIFYKIVSELLSNFSTNYGENMIRDRIHRKLS